MAEPLTIKISTQKTRITENRVSGNKTAENESGTSALKIASISQLTRFAIDSAKSCVKYSLSNYGNFTGDYIKQAEIDNKMETLGNVITVGGAIVTSIATKNPIYAITTIGSMALNYSQSYRSDMLALAKTNAQAGFNSNIIGSILTNGSR